jgi:hypothetical protein
MFEVSWKGIIIVLLALLPNLIFVAFPPKNAPGDIMDGGLLINILEHGARMLLFTVLIFITKDKEVSYVNPSFIGMCICLVFYYMLWIRYFMGGQEFSLLSATFIGIPAPMAVFPILYFMFAALWFKSVPLVILTGLFAIGHITNLNIGFNK